MASSSPIGKLTMLAVVTGIGVAGYLSIGHGPVTPKGTLAGSIIPIDTSIANSVNQITFDNNEVSEPLQQNALNIIFTPNTSAVTDGAPLSQAITAGKDVYGYKYASGDATMEFAAKTTYDNGGFAAFLDRFPGEFFASDTALASDQSLAGFRARHPEIVVHPLSDVTLEKNARYAVTTPDTNVSFTVSGLAGECTPSALTRLGSFALDQTSDVAMSGHYAYITTMTDSGVIVMDMTDATHPRTVTIADVKINEGRIAIQGKYAYIASGYTESGGALAGLSILDISNPNSPRLIKHYQNSRSSYQDIVVSGSYAYLAGGLYGFQILNISNPNNPTVVDSFENFPWDGNHEYFSRVNRENNMLYFTDTGIMIEMYDASNLSNPVFKGWENIPLMTDAAIKHQLAYVTGPANLTESSSQLRIFDFSNAGFGTNDLISRLDLAYQSSPSFQFTFSADTLVDHYLYTLSEPAERYGIVDVRNPRAPTWLTEGTILQANASDLKIFGNLAYVFGRDGVEVYGLNCH